MCGIAGFATAPGAEVGGPAAALLESLRRRGPDGEWAAVRGRHCLVQTRLAVIDLDPGVVYPMPNETEDVWLLFNGEIYDHELLRRELEGRGHRFRTRCDAEVVVHGWEEWGAELLPRLNGIFALAIVDERHDEIVLARDRFGVKPLVHTAAGPLAFASDALALVRAGFSDGVLDDAAVGEYLALHYLAPPLTGVEGLVDLAPGTLLRVAGGGERTTSRWASADLEPPAPEGEVPLDELDAALRAAVRRQLVADVDVGVLLSSGIDSSLVLRYAVDAGARPHAFTVGFAGFGDYDERGGAAELAQRLELPHDYVELDVGFVEAIDGHVGAFDRPFGDASAIAMLRLARLARPKVTVALSGTGGDELFCGYYRHRAHLLRRAASVVPRRPVAALARRLDREGARGSALALFASYADRLTAAAAESDAEQYLALLLQRNADGLIPDVDVTAAAAAMATRTGLARREGNTPGRDFAGYDAMNYLPADLLVKEDRSSMAVGLEARVPLLDNTILELARRMPDAQKHDLRAGKLPLRALAKRHLPGSIHRGRKRGFAVPLDGLLRGSWRADAQEWFGGLDSPLVDGERVGAALADGGPVHGPTVWALAALAGWDRELSRARRAAAAPPSWTPVLS